MRCNVRKPPPPLGLLFQPPPPRSCHSQLLLHRQAVRQKIELWVPQSIRLFSSRFYLLCKVLPHRGDQEEVLLSRSPRPSYHLFGRFEENKLRGLGRFQNSLGGRGCYNRFETVSVARYSLGGFSWLKKLNNHELLDRLLVNSVRTFCWNRSICELLKLSILGCFGVSCLAL